MSIVLLDARRPCQHCGKLCKPTGLKLHERACPHNPGRRLIGRSVALAAPAEPEPAPVVEAEPVAPALVVCGNCGREGTPAISRPEWCKPCVAGGAEVRAAWPAPPPRSPLAEAALSLLERTDDPTLVDTARRAYLRARAVDFKILETRG